MVVVAIAAILATLAAPSFTDVIVRKRLEGAAEKLYADLQFAKAEAIKRNASVFINFKTTTPQCYGLSLAASCDCAATSCTIDGVAKVVNMSDFGKTTFSETFSGTEINFDPRRGEFSLAGTVTFTAPNGKAANVVLHTNRLRFKICSPSGTSHLNAYSNC